MIENKTILNDKNKEEIASLFVNYEVETNKFEVRKAEILDYYNQFLANGKYFLTYRKGKPYLKEDKTNAIVHDPDIYRRFQV